MKVVRSSSLCEPACVAGQSYHQAAATPTARIFTSTHCFFINVGLDYEAISF